jgi:hypothetical protein
MVRIMKLKIVGLSSKVLSQLLIFLSSDENDLKAPDHRFIQTDTGPKEKVPFAQLDRAERSVEESKTAHPVYDVVIEVIQEISTCQGGQDVGEFLVPSHFLTALNKALNIYP